jgi:hypothetical protein
MGSPKRKFEKLSENLLAKNYISVIVNLVLAIDNDVKLIDPPFHLILEVHLEQIEVIVKKQLSISNVRYQAVSYSAE